MPDELTYRIDFSISRSENGGDYREIGFGGATDEATIDAALYSIDSIIQRGEWETNA